MTLTELEVVLRAQLKGLAARYTEAQLKTHIGQGVRHYSRLRPRLRPLTLSILAGTDTYNLPSDWLAMEPESWAKAIEPTYATIQLYDGRGYGRVDTADVTPDLPEASGITETPPEYILYPGNPAQLVIDPEPSAARTLKTRYYASHSVTADASTVPPGDDDILLDLGEYYALNGWSSERHGLVESFADNAGRRIQHVKAADVEARALAALKRAEDKLNRPTGVLG